MAASDLRHLQDLPTGPPVAEGLGDLTAPATSQAVWGCLSPECKA